MLLLGCIAAPLRAYNHPEIRWKTVSTRHFRIHYYDKTEPAVYAAAKIAENSYERLAHLYGYKFHRRIHLSLAAWDDYSNGLAGWTQENIMVWLPDADFQLRGNTVWLRNVISHELAHIISLDKYGFQLLQWNFGLEYQSPGTRVQWVNPTAMTTFYPMWFAEGTAQWESAGEGHDCWDSRRDMVFRCAVLDRKVLSLAEMSHFNHNSLGNEMVYNQGYSFVRYLHGRIGEERLRTLWNRGRRLTIGGEPFDRLFEEVGGKSPRTLYDAWLDSLEQAYGSSVPHAPTPVRPVWSAGFMNLAPRISADGSLQGWLTNEGDDSRRTDLVVVRPGELQPLARIKYARMSWDFSANSRTVYFIKAREPDRDGSFFNEIYSHELATGEQRRRSRGGRVYEIAVSPVNGAVACVRFHEGVFSIDRFYPGPETFERLVEGVPGQPFRGLCFSPTDSARLAVSRIVEGTSTLMLLDLTDGSLSTLSESGAQEESPFWASDGRIYFSADYTGVFNIYSITPEGKDMQRHSRIAGGLFCPRKTPEGDFLASEYTSEGFRIVTLEDNPESVEIPTEGRFSFEELPKPSGKVRIKSREYEAERLRGAWAASMFARFRDPYGALGRMARRGGWNRFGDSLFTQLDVGLGMFQSDALGKRERAFGISLALAHTGGPVEEEEEIVEDTLSTMLLADDGGLRRDGLEPRIARRVRRRFVNRASPRIGNLSLRAASQQSSEEDSVSEEPPLDWLPLLIPELMLRYRTGRPTVEWYAQARILMYYPLAVLSSLPIELRLGRDLYAGVEPGAALIYLQAFQFQLPFWIEWRTLGYYHQDLLYTGRDISTAGAAFGPFIEPNVEDQDSGGVDPEDVSISYVRGFLLSGQASRGIPVGRHASLSLEFQGTGTWRSDTVEPVQSELSEPAAFYFDGVSRVSWNTPLLREINRGRWRYIEDIYGHLFYELAVESDDRFFRKMSARHFTDAEFDTLHAYRSHRLGLGATLGAVSSYTFARLVAVSAAWDPWHERLFFSLTAGF